MPRLAHRDELYLRARAGTNGDLPDLVHAARAERDQSRRRLVGFVRAIARERLRSARLMVRKFAGWAIFILALGGAGFGVWRWRTASVEPEVAYRTAPVEKRTISARVTASGTLQATVTVEVGAQVSGRISKLFADFNTVVKKGQIIAKLDPQLFVAAVERERANYAAAKAGVTRAEAQEKDAELALRRAKSLNEQGLASASELQTAETALAVAVAQTEVARATLQQQRAALNQAQVNLSYTDILSPIDGVVISRDVDVGQTVAASLQAPVLFTIAEDLEKMEVHTNVAEGDVGRLEAGMDAWFTVDAFPGQRFKGTISQIRNAAQTVQNVVTYDAVIAVDNEDLRLRPGMTATTTIVFAEREGVLAVPNAALRFRPPAEITGAPGSAAPARALPVTGGSVGGRPSGPAGPKGANEGARTIWVLRGGRPEPVEIKTGLSDGTLTEVASGPLQEGDEVVTDAVAPGKPSSGPPGRPPRMGRMF